jgi:hypothetical protein
MIARRRGAARPGRRRRCAAAKELMVNATLWIVQGLLALVFLFTGGMKLLMPIEELTAQTPLPGWFIRFLGAAEVLGAIGLILPGLLKIKPGLTPLAASGLVIIMIGATVLSAVGFGGMPPITALIPLVIGLLAAFVAYGRRHWATHDEHVHAEEREHAHAGR